MNIRTTLESPGYGLHIKPESNEKSRFSRSTWRAAILVMILIAMLGTSSCVDLSAIGHLAKYSLDVANGFTKMQDDAEPSCKKAADFVTWLSPGFARHPNPLPDCAFYEKINPTVLDVNNVLFKYIAALGKLASAAKPKDAFDKVDTDLKQYDEKIDPTIPPEAKAAGALADALTNLLASQYQQHELAKIIGNANPDVKKVADFLSNYAADQYAFVLQEELLDERNYCQDRDDTFGKTHLEPLANKLLQDHCLADEKRIQSKLDAIAKYKEALKAIVDAHQKLYDSRNKWNTKQIVDDLGPDILKVGSAALAVNTAF
jgi:hypothetical protein